MDTQTPAPALSLASLIAPANKTAWVEFKEGIAFEMVFVSKSKFKSITDQCTTLQFDPRSKVHQPRLDSIKLIELFVKEAVKSWRNVTPEKVSLIAPLDLSKVPQDQMQTEIPFNYEQLVALVKETYELDTFLQEAAMDIRCFNTGNVPKEDSAKN